MEESYISAIGISSRISDGRKKSGILLELICDHSSNNSSCEEDEVFESEENSKNQPKNSLG